LAIRPRDGLCPIDLTAPDVSGEWTRQNLDGTAMLVDVACPSRKRFGKPMVNPRAAVSVGGELHRPRSKDVTRVAPLKAAGGLRQELEPRKRRSGMQAFSSAVGGVVITVRYQPMETAKALS
jgi:hypothetical protein